MRNGYHHVRIENIIEENENVRSFVLDADFKSKSGQFVGVWLPGVDKKPISLSSPKMITVRKVGPFTEKLFEKTKGSYLDIKGPLGNKFPYSGRMVAIGGGIGIAPLYHFFSDGFPILTHFVLAGKTESDLIFLDKITRNYEDSPITRIIGAQDNVIAVTDDGSYGIKGVASAATIPKADKYLICGPEVMMKDVADKLVREGVGPEQIFLSMERYMKCVDGLCGECSFSGYRVCADGPVFSYDVVKDLPHFNEMGRSRTGELVKLEELKPKKKT